MNKAAIATGWTPGERCCTDNPTQPSERGEGTQEKRRAHRQCGPQEIDVEDDEKYVVGNIFSETAQKPAERDSVPIHRHRETNFGQTITLPDGR